MMVYIYIPLIPGIAPNNNILPSSGLVDTLCNEVSRKRLLKHFLVFKRIVDLTIRHAKGMGNERT